MIFRGSEIPPDLIEFFEPANEAAAKDTWTLGPEPFPEAHFATYPTEIPRRAIKAGTSEYGVCASCGSPWVRQVERAKTYGSYHDHVDDLVLGQRHEKGKKLTGSDYYTSYEPPKTTGWAPSCACNADVIPATVLDPFLGSGTTMLVAEELNRVCIGIELNPEYAAMAERRIRSTYALLVGGYA